MLFTKILQKESLFSSHFDKTQSILKETRIAMVYPTVQLLHFDLSTRFSQSVQLKCTIMEMVEMKLNKEKHSYAMLAKTSPRSGVEVASTSRDADESNNGMRGRVYILMAFELLECLIDSRSPRSPRSSRLYDLPNLLPPNRNRRD